MSRTSNTFCRWSCLIVGLSTGFFSSADTLSPLDCLIKPEMYIELSSPVDGVLESVLVNKSDTVIKGQDLAKLESSVEAATVDLARKKATMEADIRSKSIHLAFTRRKQERMKKLYQKKVVSYGEKDEADTEMALAKMALNKAESDQKIAQLELRRALAQLEKRTVRSPISGVVLEQIVMPGELVNDRPILRLAQIDPLRVEVIAPTEFFGLIKTGMRAEIIPEAPADAVYQASVSVVDKIIDAASGSFVFHLSLPNPDRQVVSGLKCQVRFLAEDQKPGGGDQLTRTNRNAMESDTQNTFQDTLKVSSEPTR